MSDPIPEAREAVEHLHSDKATVPPESIISEACFAYHQRKLAESGGDVREVADKIWEHNRLTSKEDNVHLALSYNQIVELLQLLTAKEVDRAQYAPGVWVCPKCGFENFRNILHVANGAISSDKTVADFACPNDGELMQQVTWKQRCASIAKVCENQIERAVKAEETIATLQKQCEELLVLSDQGTATIHRWQKLIADLEQERDDLRTRAEAAEKKVVSQEHSQAANQAWLKEFDALKSAKVIGKFKLGERVTKVTGDYAFTGYVVSVFNKKTLPLVRYVVENVDGILHIFSEKQLLSCIDPENPPT